MTRRTKLRQMVLSQVTGNLSYQEHRKSFIREPKNQKITLVGLLNCENKHVISALAGLGGCK